MSKILNILEIVNDCADFTIIRVNLPDGDEALDAAMMKVQDMRSGDFSSRLEFIEVCSGKEMHPIIAEHELIKHSTSIDIPNNGIKCKFLFEKNYKVVQKPLTIKKFSDGLPTTTSPNACLITKPISDIILADHQLKNIIDQQYILGWFSIKKTSTRIKFTRRKYIGSKVKLHRLYKNKQLVFESTVKNEITTFMKNDSNISPNPSVVYHTESIAVTQDLSPLNVYDQNITKYNARLKIYFLSKKSYNASNNTGWLFYVPK